MQNTPTKIVFSRRVALYLKDQGFQIVGIDRNNYNPEYTCYIFEKTPDLMIAFDNIVRNLK